MKPKLFFNDKLVQAWDETMARLYFAKECKNPIALQATLNDGQKLVVWADRKDLERCGVYPQGNKQNET